MPHLLAAIEDPATSAPIRLLAAHFFMRGGTRPGISGPHLTSEQQAWNQRVTKDDQLLRSFLWTPAATSAEVSRKISDMQQWFDANRSILWI